MVKKDLAHFDEVGAACAALKARGLMPTPHVPACRFANLAEADATLDALSSAGEGALTLGTFALRCSTRSLPQHHRGAMLARARACAARPQKAGRRREQ